MRSASRTATEAVRDVKGPVIDGAGSVAELQALAGDLYGMGNVLVSEPRLRRLLGDSATAADGRAALLESVFAGGVSADAVTIGQGIVRQRWSSPWDMTDAFEAGGDDALFGAADRDGVLDEVVDELFRFERILDANSNLSSVLDEPAVDPERRVKLLDDVLDDKVLPITTSLLEHAVRSRRKKSLTLAIDNLLDEASRRQHRSMARVLSAVELSAEQRERLSAALGELYGRQISVRTAVDPDVIGGLVVQVGDEIINGSIASRLTEARLSMTGGATNVRHNQN